MTSLITDFQLLEGIHLRDFEAIDRACPDLDGSEAASVGGTGFPAAPRPHRGKARDRLAALAARVGLW